MAVTAHGLNRRPDGRPNSFGGRVAAAAFRKGINSASGMATRWALSTAATRGKGVASAGAALAPPDTAPAAAAASPRFAGEARARCAAAAGCTTTLAPAAAVGVDRRPGEERERAPLRRGVKLAREAAGELPAPLDARRRFLRRFLAAGAAAGVGGALSSEEESKSMTSAILWSRWASTPATQRACRITRLFGRASKEQDFDVWLKTGIPILASWRARYLSIAQAVGWICGTRHRRAAAIEGRPRLWQHTRWSLHHLRAPGGSSHHNRPLVSVAADTQS